MTQPRTPQRNLRDELQILKELNHNLKSQLHDEFLQLLDSYKKKIAIQDAEAQLKSGLYSFSLQLKTQENNKKTKK